MLEGLPRDERDDGSERWEADADDAAAVFDDGPDHGIIHRPVDGERGEVDLGD